MVHFIIKIPINSKVEDILDCFLKVPSSLSFNDSKKYKFLTWGDPIFTDDLSAILDESLHPEAVLKHVAGHFYYILQDKAARKIYFGNSLFGILPVFYSVSDGAIFFSDKVLSLADYIHTSVNYRFILENILFNYPLFNISCFNEVLLLPANHAIEITPRSYSLKEIIKIEDLFTERPLSKRKSRKLIVEAFLSNVDKYYPEKSFFLALTGGFDGRTLVACAKWFRKQFITYTFGSKGSNDLRLASKIALISTLDHRSIELDYQYIKEYSLKYGIVFIENSNGTASFARAHYQFAVDKLSRESDVFITGNFGSEVFRAAHIAGEVVSENLYHLFKSKDYNQAIAKLNDAPEWKWVNKSVFEKSKRELYEDLKKFPAFSYKYQSLTTNQKFYKVVFDEILRKYFGAEMLNQFQGVKNRTPFLDYNFLKCILQSKYAGVHSDFFTHNPLKRFKGQVIYSYVLKKTNKLLFKLPTDKGYRPSEILSVFGNSKILVSYLSKKIIKKNKSSTDPYAVSGSYQYNKKYWFSIPIDTDLFNEKVIRNEQKGSKSLYIILSQVWWSNRISQRIGKI